MAIEYINGDFEIGDFEEMREKFLEMTSLGVPVRALHAGTFGELQERKEEINLRKRIELLEEKVKETAVITSTVLHLPTKDEVNNYGWGT